MNRVKSRRLSIVMDGYKRALAIAMIAQQLTPSLSAHAAFEKTGRWVATPSLGFSATHVVLLREPVTNKAKVFMFGESGSPQEMRFWTIDPGDTNLLTPLTSSARSSLTVIPHPNNKATDLFCSGHATLPDGKMILVGGQWLPTETCEDGYTLDPAWSGSGMAWQQNAEMSSQRWYATATPLPDGRILASAGTSESGMMGFGGTVPGVTTPDTVSRTIRPLGLSARFTWRDTLLLPACNGSGCTPLPFAPGDNYTVGRFPPGRDFHMFAGPADGRAIIYGGRRSSSTDLLSDVWYVNSTAFPKDSTHNCYLLEQVGDPALPDSVNKPVARWGFGFTWAGVEINPKGMTREVTQAIPGSSICYIHGGKDSSGQVLGDLWRGHLIQNGARYQWVWKRILDNSDASRARFGHTMVFDPGVPDSADWAPRAKLMIYGGALSGGVLADNTKLYLVGVGARSNQPGVWRSITPTATVADPAPPGRTWHGMIPKYKGPDDDEREYFLFGGENASGTPVAPTMYMLARADGAPPNSETQGDEEAYAWEVKPTTGGGPSARSRPSMGYAVDGGLLVVYGGDTTGTAVAGGLSNGLFRLQAGYNATSWSWSSPSGRSFHPSPPPTAGMPLHAMGEGRGRISRNLEAFTGTGSSNMQQCNNVTGFGSWQAVSQPNAQSERPIANYPNLYVLPDGRLFNAGPAPGRDLPNNKYRRFFDFSNRMWSEADSAGVQDAAFFGSSVMYRPGKILRMGGTIETGHDKTELIDLSVALSQASWLPYLPDTSERPSSLRRTHANLTVLPTGDVLASGGVPDDDKINDATTKTPQLWSVAAGRWTSGKQTDIDVLAPNPHIRNYHSIAILLPDARVLTAGGEKNSADETTSSVFEPPYLFRSNGAYATRPRVQHGPDIIPYGRPLTMKLTDISRSGHIKSVALLRPGSVTHSFDQGQRYVPLEFVARTNPDRLLIHGPANANFAPPGDYLLFVVDSVAVDAPRVPSVARWVRVVLGSPAVVDTADVTAPKGGSFTGLHVVGPSLPGTLHLGWTAPADDDTLAFSGSASRYDLRFVPLATTPVPDFSQWTQSTVDAPGTYLTAEDGLATGMQSSTWYRFLIKSVDDHENISAASDTLIAKTSATPQGGGGGYEEGDPGCGFCLRASQASLGAPSGSSPGRENTVFPGAVNGGTTADVLRLAGAPRLREGMRNLYVRAGLAQGLSIDRARLIAVDHASGTESMPDGSGGFVTGMRIPAINVVDRNARDVTANATHTANAPVYADSGEVLEVTLPAITGASGRILLELSDGGSGDGGVSVTAHASAEESTLIAKVHPRVMGSSYSFPVGPETHIRLRFHEACALRYVGRLASTESVSGLAAMLSAAEFGGFDAVAAVTAVDSLTATVTAGDTLRISFEDVTAVEGMERDWYLALEGGPISPEIAVFRSRGASEPATVPATFALRQNVPNPFSTGTVIAFDLPRATEVKLEIFDAQGRLVRMFATYKAAGRHSIGWDLQDARGSRVRSGVYTYRLRAGGYEARRKMVVVP